MWKKERLQQTIQKSLEDYLLVVVSNRQPYSHVYQNGKLICQRQPGGLVTALTPVMEATDGLWIASANSPHDRLPLDEDGTVKLPPENPSYRLKRIFLSKEDMNGYYYGYSNEGIWPLCHIAYERPIFRASDWAAYQRVNQIFAKAIAEQVGSRKAFVWIHDYHLMLVGKYLKEMGCTNIITACFWHIPWPNPEVFQICPQKKELLAGMLAYDLLGFHIKYHCDQFLASVDKELESRIDREKISVTYQEHETFVRNFPISVDFNAISEFAATERAVKRGREIRENTFSLDKKLFVGVDRVDYTKGIVERLRGIDRFCEKYPEYKEKFVFFQIGEISRLRIPRYKQLNDEINALVEEINWKHSQGSWAPITLTRSYMNYSDILSLYRTSDACLVSSLHDGMNLVAKEFIAARPDLGGALILSEFTGAARELTDAFIVNPYDSESIADAMLQVMTMTDADKEKRMQKMRAAVEENNIFRWAARVLAQLLKFEFQEA